MQKTTRYIALRGQLEHEGLTIAQVLQRATPALKAVFTDLQHLVDADDAWAQSVEASARRLDATDDVLGLAVAAVLLGGFAAAFVASERLLERPVVAVNEAMTRFERGETSVRATLQGARELREIAATFNGLADRLTRQEQERTEFLAGVAHDLRNPLTPLTLALARFERGAQPPSAEAAARLIAVVCKQVGRLDAMVSDLLDATRIRAGRLELQPSDVDLHTLVDGVVALYSPMSQEYSPSGGPVLLRLARGADEISVDCCDEGIGVPETERERIFEPFHRTGRSREVAPGVGLGLSVSRRIAQAHGGRLELEKQERGTTFRLTLPAAKQAA